MTRWPKRELDKLHQHYILVFQAKNDVVRTVVRQHAHDVNATVGVSKDRCAIAVASLCGHCRCMPFEDICWFYFEDGAAAVSNKKMRGTWCANCGCIIGDDGHVYLVTSQNTRKTEESTVFTGNAPPLGIIATTLNGLALANNVCSGSEDGYRRKLAKKTRDQFLMARGSLVDEDVLQEL